VKLEEIKEMITFLEKSKLNKLRLKEGDFELLLEKGFGYEYKQPIPLPTELSNSSFSKKDKTEDLSNCKFVKSPMVGTFYKTPAPDKPSFVKVGDVVSEDTVICIIEAMKVMNEVKSGVSGVIKEVLCKNTQPVEFGTKLFKIE
jgi:acetyl-CoA carboxylase biotin carboxyl carrier protein